MFCFIGSAEYSWRERGGERERGREREKQRERDIGEKESKRVEADVQKEEC